MKEIKKILVLRFSSLGDILMTTAMLRCARNRFPDAQIDMVVREDFLDLIRENPHLNFKIGLGRKEGLRGLWNLLQQINREHYDLIYDAHRSLRTRLLMPFLKATHKAYFQKHYLRRNLSLLLKVSWMGNFGRFLERYVSPLHKFGVIYDGKGPEMFTTPAADISVEKAFPLPKSEENLTVGIIPSAQWPGKRRSESRFREVVNTIVKKTKWNVVVFGGKSDTFCSEIAASFPADRVINGQGRLSISEAASVLKQCRFVIANDTGLMHLADALNIPSVLIFGPTSADLGCLPFHPSTEVVERKLWCRPCSKNGQAPCIRGQRLCLEEILPSQVFQAALAVARRTGRL